MSKETQTTLDARLVIGGLWHTAPIIATRTIGGRVIPDAAYIANEKGAAFIAIGEPCRGVNALWRLSLHLPGPLGLGLVGLDARIKERVDEDGPGKMPEWFYGALGAAGFDGNGSQWLSTYLVRTDALAAKLGWPTGPGAPVYEWWHDGDDDEWVFGIDGGRCVSYTADPDSGTPAIYVPTLEGITDPLEALAAVCARVSPP